MYLQMSAGGWDNLHRHFAAFQFATAVSPAGDLIHCLYHRWSTSSDFGMFDITRSLFPFLHKWKAWGQQWTVCQAWHHWHLSFSLPARKTNRASITQRSRPSLGIKSVRLIYFGFINLGSRDSLAHEKNNDSCFRVITSEWRHNCKYCVPLLQVGHDCKQHL